MVLKTQIPHLLASSRQTKLLRPSFVILFMQTGHFWLYLYQGMRCDDKFYLHYIRLMSDVANGARFGARFISVSVTT